MMSFIPTPEQVQWDWPSDFNHLVKRYRNLNNLNYEEACQLGDDFINFKNYYCKRMGIYDYFDPGPYGANIKEISDRKTELLIKKDQMAALYYSDETKIMMTEYEEVNGYKLYEIDQNIMSYEDFIKYRKTLNTHTPDKEFLEWLNDNCCGDWYKQDRHGKCLGGFWQYPEGSYARENAYALSGEDNFKGLCELPYPRELIKETIRIGCSNRMESVRYSNFICEWIKRKGNLMYKCPSLKTLIATVVSTMPDCDKNNLPQDIIDLLE